LLLILKTLVSQAPVLKFYNPNLALKISSDASQTGLGAILEQQHDNQWHPIAYASRSLSNAEKNYSQIEKETHQLCLHVNVFMSMFTAKSLL